MTLPLVILDRDGVINQDSPHFIKTMAEWIPIPGSLDGIAQLKHAGFTVAVATNQSGLARGLLARSDLEAMHARLAELLADRDCQLDFIAVCPHGPDDGCDCRKPKPGLYRQISARLNLPLEGAWVIGDSKRDLDAAAAVGAQPLLVLTGKGHATRNQGGLPEGTRVFENLASAVKGLLEASAQEEESGARA